MKTTNFVIAIAVLAGAITFTTVGSTEVANAAACSPSADYGTVTQSVTIPSDGTYRIWSRIKATSSGAEYYNSYLLEIDGSTCIRVGDNKDFIADNVWTWVDWQDSDQSSKINQTLTAGNHSIVMYGNEPNVELDRVIFTTDTSCTPTGTGDNCANPPDTTPPIVSISSPADGTTANGTITITAAASDDSGVINKVEFYVDGSLVGTDTTSPYNYSFDPSQYAVGDHNIYARAYDGENVTANSATIAVTIPDTSNPTILDTDIDMDGVVYYLDFAIFAEQYGKSGSGLGRSDINNDSTVNYLDFALFSDDYGVGVYR